MVSRISCIAYAPLLESGFRIASVRFHERPIGYKDYVRLVFSTLVSISISHPMAEGIAMKKLPCCAALFVLVISSKLAGQTVVVDDNIMFVPDSAFGLGNHRGTVQQIAAGDSTSVWFDYDGSHLTAVTWNLDEESDWYVVNPGDAFGFASLESGQFTPIFTTDNSRGPVFVGDGEFYLGVSTSGQGLPVPFPQRNVFGWVRLEGTAIPGFPPIIPATGRLEMLGNAVAYNSLGIIVGTAEVVPEPSGITLGWLALVALGLFKRNQKQLSHF
jgi:hypothetical protein